MAGRPDKQGKRMQLEIGLYKCPKCGASFREVLRKKIIFKNKATQKRVKFELSKLWKRNNY
jgi:uncharacterized protein (UPF0212 family)